MGLAIVALTLLVRIMLVPSFQKSLRSQKELQQLQPHLDEIREKHKDNKEAQTKAIMEFYQQKKVNPFSSCLPLLVQLPILIALYRVFLTGLNGDVAAELYPFVANPGAINTNFLGVLELSTPSYVLAILAGGFQFIQSKMMAPARPKTSDKTSAMMSAQMTYLMPIITVFIAWQLPAGLSLYWVVTTLFAIGQQYYIMKKT